MNVLKAAERLVAADPHGDDACTEFALCLLAAHAAVDEAQRFDQKLKANGWFFGKYDHGFQKALAAYREITK